MAGPDWLGFITCYFQGKKISGKDIRSNYRRRSNFKIGEIRFVNSLIVIIFLFTLIDPF